MKKTLLLLLLAVVTITVSAQDAQQQPQVKFARISYSEALRSMTGYATMQKNLDALRKQYSDETKRAEEEFNTKYEAFLEGQKDFAPAILEKRQSELQELLDKNIAFKKEAERLLQQAENDMTTPLKRQLDTILSKVARDRGYALILNSDGDAVPFADPNFAEDITQFVKNLLANL